MKEEQSDMGYLQEWIEAKAKLAILKYQNYEWLHTVEEEQKHER